jgi:hypothetical protein
MSRILPEPVVGQFAPEVLEVYRALRAIPDDELTVWVSLPLPGAENRPHFLAVARERRAFLLAVSQATAAEVEGAAGLSLFPHDLGARPPGQIEANVLRTFFSDALSSAPGDHAGGVVTGVVIFPQVPQSTLDALPHDLRPGDVFFLGSEATRASVLAGFLQRETPPELDPVAVSLLRSAYTPESVVPLHFSAGRIVDRNVEAKLAPLLLDFDQEQWAKQRLVLSAEGMRVAEGGVGRGEATLVTGVAGSGKSLVLLFRACTQARLAPQSRSLVLTHNRALKTELESRFGDLGRPGNVQWHTFFSWLHQLVTSRQQFPRIVQYQERDERIAAAAEPYWGLLDRARLQFLAEEFDWMQDRDVVEEVVYLAVDRGGRGVRLGESLRRRVFRTFAAYRENLQRDGNEDWSGVALLTWRLIESGQLSLPVFDFIYIDEAQFFAPVWFQIIQRALRPGMGRMAMAADPTQGFLKRRQSWVTCGLDLRGRSTKLRRSYRSTREILRFAAHFYRTRMDDEEWPDLNLPGEEELQAASSGYPPRVLFFSSRQDEVARVANEISSCLQDGFQPEHVLVVVAGEKRFSVVVDSLRAVLGVDQVADAREKSEENRVRVSGINAATGLEAPLVFVVGAADLLAAEANFQLKEAVRMELIRDNTRRLYMAFTRAGHSLVVTWAGASVPGWLKQAEETAADFSLAGPD